MTNEKTKTETHELVATNDYCTNRTIMQGTYRECRNALRRIENKRPHTAWKPGQISTGETLHVFKIEQ